MSEKTLEIVSKKVADSLLVDSLFHPVNGHTLFLGPLNETHYKPKQFHLGDVVTVSSSVLAVFVQHFRGYDMLFSVTLP